MLEQQQPAVVESQMPNVSTGDGEHIERNERRRLSAGQSTRAIGAGPEALLQHIEAQAPFDPSHGLPVDFAADGDLSASCGRELGK